MGLIKFGSVFTGAGGIDLGFERAGMVCVWQAEKNRQCRELLSRHWPNTKRVEDVTKIIAPDGTVGLEAIQVLAGGDPCPVRSRAARGRTSSHPDLSGWFLALAGVMRPRWVVRENVCASDVGHFAAGLELLGYGSVVIRIDACEITGQSRPRDFVVGRYQTARRSLRQIFSLARGGWSSMQTVLGHRQVATALHTHRGRLGYSDNYIYEDGRGIRLPDDEECERLAGFPDGWTDGFSATARFRFCGNSCVPAKAEWIGRIITEN